MQFRKSKNWKYLYNVASQEKTGKTVQREEPGDQEESDRAHQAGQLEGESAAKKEGRHPVEKPEVGAGVQANPVTKE